MSSSSSPAVKAAYWLLDEDCLITDILFTVASAADIDFTLFTHIFCSFNSSSTNSSKCSEFVETVRKKNKEVQLLVSFLIKSVDECSEFASTITDSSSRKQLINQMIKIARVLGFDGIDIDWEYPRNDVEMTDLGLLLKESRSAIEEESLSTNQPRLRLTAAVFYSPDYETFRYPVKEIVESVDWVNLIFFDFYKSGSSLVTGPPGALFDPSNPQGLCGDSGLNQWIEAGLPEDKAVFGFSYAGWGWMLEDVNNHGYGAPIRVIEKPFIEYANIKKCILGSGAAMVHDPIVVGDYCYAGTRWIGYDDNPSIVKKVTYAHKRGLRGYFGWHLGADYKCGLSRAANQAWNVAEAAITGQENPTEE